MSERRLDSSLVPLLIAVFPSLKTRSEMAIHRFPAPVWLVYGNRCVNDVVADRRLRRFLDLA